MREDIGLGFAIALTIVTLPYYKDGKPAEKKAEVNLVRKTS
jgi:hypothetical protein